MTPQEAAATLDGCEYGKEGKPALFKEMKRNGLVAVYGGSDDNMEFRGAINDEVSCYQGGTAYLTSAGLLTSECEEGDDCPYFKPLKEAADKIEAVWDEDGISWQYKTEIPHVTFIVKEEGEDWCRGIVLDLAEVKQ
jgi:hypothetical protein